MQDVAAVVDDTPLNDTGARIARDAVLSAYGATQYNLQQAQGKVAAHGLPKHKRFIDMLAFNVCTLRCMLQECQHMHPLPCKSNPQIGKASFDDCTPCCCKQQLSLGQEPLLSDAACGRPRVDQ